MADILNAALDWAKRGVPVFPCGPNKAPLTKNGHLNASVDPAQVRFMFEGVGDDVMIGARMGQDSGLFCIDFDTYKGDHAERYMQSLVDEGLLNETQIHTTQSGGLHLLYRGDGLFPNCKPHIGVEVKGEGGYIIVPPSRGYAIQKTGIAYARPELVSRILAAQRENSSSTVDQLKRDVLAGKSFHDPLAQIAARRSAQGWPPERVQQELLDTLRASAASAPSHARHARWRALLEDRGEELSRIVGSGNDKYNPHKHTDIARDAIGVDKQQALLGGSASLFQRPDPDAVPQPGSVDDVDGWPFDGAGYFSYDDRDIFDQKYVAYPLFAERESVLLAAEPKAGKTNIALKLCMQVAFGESLGRTFQVATQRPVLYFTLEGARAVEMRVKAEHERRAARGAEKPEHDMLFIVDRPHNFAENDARAANVAKIVQHNYMCVKQFGHELGVVVVDTLTKAMPGRDQNSVEDTSQLFELISDLRSYGVKATIIFIHHLAKTGQVRGSTNIEAEVDLVLGVQKNKKTGMVEMNIRRARSMDEDIDYFFKFESHYLGKTKQGFDLHAPVTIMHEDVEPDVASVARAAKAQSAVSQALVDLGTGTHDTRRVVEALCKVTEIPRPRNKRHDCVDATYTAALNLALDGKVNFSYGNYIIRINKNHLHHIESVTILHAV